MTKRGWLETLPANWATKCCFVDCPLPWTQELRDRNFNVYHVCDTHAAAIRPIPVFEEPKQP